MARGLSNVSALPANPQWITIERTDTYICRSLRLFSLLVVWRIA